MCQQSVWGPVSSISLRREAHPGLLTEEREEMLEEEGGCTGHRLMSGVGTQVHGFTCTQRYIVKMCRLTGTHMNRYIVTTMYTGGAHVCSYTVPRQSAGQVHSSMCTLAVCVVSVCMGTWQIDT